MGFMDGFERGLSGNYRYEIAGKAVVCSRNSMSARGN